MVVGQTGALHRRVPRKSRGTLWRRRRAQAPPTSGGGKPTPDFLSSVASTAARESWRVVVHPDSTRIQPSLSIPSRRALFEREREIFLVLESMQRHGFEVVRGAILKRGFVKHLARPSFPRPNYEGERLRLLSRGGREGSDGCRHVCVYVYILERLSRTSNRSFLE